MTASLLCTDCGSDSGSVQPHDLLCGPCRQAAYLRSIAERPPRRPGPYDEAPMDHVPVREPYDVGVSDDVA